MVERKMDLLYDWNAQLDYEINIPAGYKIWRGKRKRDELK